MTNIGRSASMWDSEDSTSRISFSDDSEPSDDSLTLEKSREDGVHSIRRPPSWHRKIMDFMNITKAFIGSNYLTLPFGFYTSGLLLGCITLVFIVAITDHCCQLIVKCKNYLVEELIAKDAPNDDGTYKRHLQKTMRYADIGRLCFGKWGVVIVDIFLVITQFGFCTGYFIFIGNTLHAVFPLKEVTVQILTPNVTINHAHSDLFSFDEDGQPMYAYNNLESYLRKNHLTSDMVHVSDSVYDNIEVRVKKYDTYVDYITNTTSYNTTISAISPVVISKTDSNVYTGTSELTTPTNSNVTTVTTETPTPPNTTVFPRNHTLIPATNTSDHAFISSAPDLKYLMFVPTIPFILFAFVRNIRKLGSISLIANIAIFVGFWTLLIIMALDFQVDPGVNFYTNWKMFPVFFGQVVSAFEGIGLVLPVQASMEGNHHNFPMYLHGALATVASILASFGIFGYLKFGSHVQQVITKNLPAFGALPLSVDACLLIAIAFTYPLQVFPVVEILERYIFKIGAAPEVQQNSSGVNTPDEEEIDEILSDASDATEEDSLLIGHTYLHQKEVATWKRNILRTIVVLAIAAFSVLMRHNFAFVSAFVGSCGSTVLAYVLPCLFHIRIRGRQLHPLIIAKDVFIIIVGIVGGVVGVVVTLQQIIESFTN